ncbi:TniQ family protein [Pseudomonas sp. P2757]|uniref:TniQ family protein n=1 Tax=unclassified Pseudomonas TaxID=196821 RepID=UPI003B5CA987
MLLKIQREESIRSFIERSLFMSRGTSEKQIFHKLSSNRLRNDQLSIISGLQGWPGCYGFNRLLHCHTDYPIYALLKGPHDLAYSDYSYARGDRFYDDDLASFCPECVKEDLKNIGFSYWRRLHRWPYKVCVRHNIKLVNSCPFCGETFRRQEHSLDFMWSGCGGKTIDRCIGVPNSDPSELKFSKDANDVCQFGFHIPAEKALETIIYRLEYISANDKQKFSDSVLLLDDARRRYTQPSNMLNSDSYKFQDYSYNFLSALSLGFESLDEFVNCLDVDSEKLLEVGSLWSCYRFIGGWDVVSYIEEDYRYGVGHWFVSVSTEEPEYKSYVEQDNSKFECCYPLPAKNGYARKNSAVPALKIPRVDDNELSILRDLSGFPHSLILFSSKQSSQLIKKTMTDDLFFQLVRMF